MNAADDYSHLIGHRFPGGTVSTASHLTWLWADAAHAHQDAELVHPSYMFLIGLRGTGISTREILALLDFKPEEGALAGGYTLEFHSPLRQDIDYRVDGEITDIVRKHGKRMGPFDRFTFVISVRDGDELVATITTTWMIPRPEEAADARSE
jgi:hypothetical protein